MDYTDEALLEGIQAGDQHCFKLLYDKYCSIVYNTALVYTKITVDAEEITQDVFTKVYTKAATFQGKSALSTWIYRITVNVSLNYVKKKKRYSFLSFLDRDQDLPDFVHPGVLLEHAEDSKVLLHAIDRLVDSQRTAFVLSYIEDLPRQDVADVMELSLKAVESLLQRGKSNLRDILGEFYENQRKL